MEEATEIGKEYAEGTYLILELNLLVYVFETKSTELLLSVII